MPIIEVDDAVAAAMQQNGIKYQDRSQYSTTAKAIVDRISALEAGPHRTEYLRLLKKQFPDLVLPEIDAAAPVVASVDALAKRFDDYLEDQKKKEEERSKKDSENLAIQTVDQGRTRLKRFRKLDDDGIKAVETLMADRGIPDYDAGYLMWREQNPLPAAQDLPTNPLGKSLDWFKEEQDQPDKSLLLKDPIAYRAQRQRQILNDLRAGKIDEFGRTINRAS